MNKYGSVLRTFMARNMIWDHTAVQGAVPNGLFALAPPAALVIDNSAAASTPPDSDLVTQFFHTTTPLMTEGWKPLANVFLKRVGLFSNFADGLVLENLEGRLGITITMAVCQPVKRTGTIIVTSGSNLVTGTNFDADLGTSLKLLLEGSKIFTPFDTREMFSIMKIDDTNARLSNYALSSYTGDTYLLSEVVKYSVALNCIPSLNNMIDVERFFPASVSIVGQNPLVYGTLTLDTLDSNFSLLTNTVSDSFATTPVSFDAVIELECTEL